MGRWLIAMERTRWRGKRVLAAKAEQEDGEQLRQGHAEHFLAAMNVGPTRVFEGAKELVKHVKAAGLQTALASSSKEE